MQFLSVVVPVHNEKELICDSIDKIHTFLNSISLAHEIIISDDGSSDNTIALVQEQKIAFALPSPQKIGKGKAIKNGIEKAKGDWILIIDADLSIPPEDIEKCIHLEEVDFFVGSKYLNKTNNGRAILRQLGGNVFRKLTKILFAIPVTDTQCGFKLIRNGFAKNITKKSVADDFIFDVEMIVLAHRQKCRIKEFPSTYIERKGKSKLNFFKTAATMFFGLIRLKRKI